VVSDTKHATTIVEVRDGPVQRMHPIVQAAMDGGSVDPTTLRDLLLVQREWEAGEARKAFTRALAGLKRDLPSVISRDRKVDFATAKGRTTYTHTSLAAVMDAITGPLTQHGFSLAWTPAIGERAVRVTCRLTHTEGHSEEATLEAPADTSGNKNPAQAIASTVTLLQRYTALSLLGIATADMDEPTGEDNSADQIDAQRNMGALRRIKQAGLSQAEAEAHVEKAVTAWTGADLRRLRTWFDARTSAEPGE
jgi:hypothetical protein